MVTQSRAARVTDPQKNGGSGAICRPESIFNSAASMLTNYPPEFRLADELKSHAAARHVRAGYRRVLALVCTLLALVTNTNTIASAQGTGAQTNGAQSAATFVFVTGKDTIAVESMQRNGNDVSSALDTRGNGRYTLDAKLDLQGLVSRLEINTYPPVGTTITTHAVITVVGDSVFAQVGPKMQRVTTQVGAIPWINPSFALLEVLLQRARHVETGAGTGAVSIPLFLIAGGATISATVTRLGADSTIVAVGTVELRLHTSADGKLLGGVVPAEQSVITRSDARYSAKGVALAPPNYQAPANAPYVSEEVTVKSPEGFTLAGTLTIPKRHAGRVPAVVMITGSGLEDRDESLPGVNGYRPFRQIADTLGRRGIAVLRLDDRGYGSSGGNASASTTADLANDTRAALSYLKSRPDIDRNHLFLVGHSEGGEIAPMVAATDAALAGIVTLAAPALSGRQISRAQLRYAVARDTALTAARRDSILRSQDAILDSAAVAQPWVRYYLSYDPLVTAKKVGVPVLLLHGGNDRQVTTDQAALLAGAFMSGGDKDVTVHVFPELNHLFLVDEAGNPGGYPMLPSKSIGPDVLGMIADWIVSHAK